MSLTTIVPFIANIIMYGFVAIIVFLIGKQIYIMFKPTINQSISYIRTYKKSILKKEIKDDPENIKVKIKELEEQVEKYKSLDKYNKDKKILEIKLKNINLKLNGLRDNER